MKKAEEWYRKYLESGNSIYDLIAEIQIEAIEETAKSCAEAAQIPYLEHGMTQLAARSKELVLEVAEQLKSKL